MKPITVFFIAAVFLAASTRGFATSSGNQGHSLTIAKAPATLLHLADNQSIPDDGQNLDPGLDGNGDGSGGSSSYTGGSSSETGGAASETSGSGSETGGSSSETGGKSGGMGDNANGTSGENPYNPNPGQ